ncbi:DUF1330 domain-containing protein [Catenovulum maritimum]|uniref:DUF1330 domain-containing protein n=1 Tax=Catenovulum maritimum TaxID=1513271 RepID=A0A0J8GQX8_9ALTE|nr:DUF1330 domain-containing protein [Catenovulum maritimum]KMT65107.1 hypothetical protein XM47_10220 [Catenovulum maritimum]
MAFERIMGIEVIDEIGYQKYRENMLPILNSFGGNFGFDFKVSEVLKSKSDKPINRVFTIDFPSEDAMKRFFSDPEYVKIKEKYFQSSVKSITTISLQEKSTQQ